MHETRNIINPGLSINAINNTSTIPEESDSLRNITLSSPSTDSDFTEASSDDQSTHESITSPDSLQTNRLYSNANSPNRQLAQTQRLHTVTTRLSRCGFIPPPLESDHHESDGTAIPTLLGRFQTAVLVTTVYIDNLNMGGGGGGGNAQ